MGLKNSPPIFSAATETIADLGLIKPYCATIKLRRTPWMAMLPHTRHCITHHQRPRIRLSLSHFHHDPTHTSIHAVARLPHIEIYVDDFIGAAQGTKWARNNVRCILLMHAIDDVFHPHAPDDPHTRQEPILVKKLRQGDAAWSPQKEVLGWLIGNTTSMTRWLAPRRYDRLSAILTQDIPHHRNRITTQEYHRVLGELRSMALALPGARGLFSILQEALCHTTPDAWIRLTPTIHSILNDFRLLHRDLPYRPTRIQELVPLSPTAHGCHGAASHGAGGVLIPTSTTVPHQARVCILPTTCQRHQQSVAPIVWRMPFPSDITARLVTHNNPHGDLTNTNLELVGSLLQAEAAAQCYDLHERTHIQCTDADNLGTMFWQCKGSTTTVKPAAILLRFQAFHQLFHQHITLHDYLDALLACVDTTTAATFVADWRAAQHAVSLGVTPSRSSSANTHWRLWANFCTELALSPFLEGIDDPVILLQVFLHCYRTSSIAPHGNPVRARTAEDVLRVDWPNVRCGGAPDPRLTPQGGMDFHLTHQIRFYKKQDPPAALTSLHAGTIAITDMVTLAFFFLPRPGEYTATPSDTTPFRLADVCLSTGGVYIDIFTTSDEALDSATFVSLTFMTQKNGVRGEVIGLGHSGSPTLCPVHATIRHIKHLRAYAALPDTPLSVYYANNTWNRVSPTNITTILRTAVIALGPSNLGFMVNDISARCLRASGAMALLCAHIDSDLIRLLGHWHSDEMLYYLHVQVELVMCTFGCNMLQGGNFVLIPNSDVPSNLRNSDC